MFAFAQYLYTHVRKKNTQKKTTTSEYEYLPRLRKGLVLQYTQTVFYETLINF